MTTTALTKENALPGRTSIICNENPKWGTWGIRRIMPYGIEINGNSGSRVLMFDDFSFWSVVTR